MAKGSCKMVPNVPGTNEPSNLYRELNALTKDRLLTNYIYAAYLQPGVAAQMDREGKKLNSQGQHSAIDVFNKFNVPKMRAEALKNTVQLSKSLGFTDSLGNLVNFTDAEDAYQRALDFNRLSSGKLAYVVANGGTFNIVLTNKNSRTIANQALLNRDMVRWQELKKELTSLGIDVKAAMRAKPELLNPGRVSDFIRSLNNLRSTPNDALTVKDIELILTLNPNHPTVKNVLSRGWGNLQETAQRLFDIVNNPATATSGNVALANNVLNQAKQLTNINRTGIRNAINAVSTTFESADDTFNIHKTLRSLEKKYNIDDEVLVRRGKQIASVSHALSDAIISLERQIRILERKSGETPASERLKLLKDKLFNELTGKQYQQGLLEFMGTAVDYLNSVSSNLKNIPVSANNLEYAKNVADAIASALNLYDAYYPVVSALTRIEKLIPDIAISSEERAKIINLSKSLKEDFDNHRAEIRELEENAMLAIGEEFIGTTNPLYAKDLADIIHLSEADTGITDYLYSVGRSSSAVISMLGAIIRDAQESRDVKLANIATEIRRATDRLYKSGKDSSFMYDKRGRIVSQYDWDRYYKERSDYMGTLKKSGIKRGTVEFNAEMQLWEDRNTENLVVDTESGRTEKVPIFKLETNFRDGWTTAQNEYYDTMMAIKGKIGTLLPNYAQHQFIAPQKEAKTDEILKKALKGEISFKQTTKAILDRWRPFKIRPDDTRYAHNGLYIDGEEAIASTSGYDNTVLRQIPVFYIRKLDLVDLSKDFSAALQGLASTALNYDAMSDIAGIAEMMTDYVNEQSVGDRDASGRAVVDYVNNAGTGIARELYKHSKSSNTSAMLEGFVMKHIYGINNLEKDVRWAQVAGGLIGYTSLKGLAVNVKGALTNRFVGVIQSIITATRGQYFNFKELAQAEAILMGANGATTVGALAGGTIGGFAGAGIGAGIGLAIGAVGKVGKIMDVLTNNKNNKDGLIAEMFDSCQEVFSDLTNQRYHKTIFGKLYGQFNPMFMYQRGEYWIHQLNTYSVLLHEKVVQYDPNTGERKQISLYEALEKGDKIDGNTELKVKDNIFKLNGEALTSTEDPYFKAIKRRIRYVNQRCHGSMNTEDKGLIHQWMMGKLTMNFRQWMVEHYSRRYRRLHWDESIRDTDLSNFYNNTKVLLNDKKVRLFDTLEMVDSGKGDNSFVYKIKDGAKTLDGAELTDDVIDNMLNTYAQDSGWRRGFWTSTAQIIADFIKEKQAYQTSAALYWNSLSETQKADVKEVLGECFMVLALTGLSAAMGDPDKHRGEFFYRLWQYTLKRCLFDEIASLPTGAVTEIKTIMNNPIASFQTINGLLYPIMGLADIDDTIKSGRFKGQNKYWRNVKKYTIPFYGQVDQLLHIGTEDYAFQVFDNTLR